VWLLTSGAQVHAALQIQQLTGEIRIEVKDPSGQAMQATGKLENLLTGVGRSFQTDAQGQYVFGNVPYGRYRLEISKSGFAAQSVLIEVQSGAPITQSVTLTLGGLAFNVDVIGTTPLPGVELEPKEIPAPVQAAKQYDIERSGALDLSDFLNRRLGGVHVNEVQGNPFQPDVNYRGYTASPLLGTPQGLSVYLDGVRLNQPFGDVVSWDLIPRIAISEIALLPGSNPLFGLNTLGGALAVQTKDGRSQPGTMIQLSGGSFGRRDVDFEHGGANAKGLHWYLASNLFFEDGWRDDSPSNVRQFFGKLGWQHAKTALGLTVAYANNSLTGNGLQEERFLARDYASVYTKPDITSNRSPFLNFTARHSLSNTLTFSGHIYDRHIRTSTYNGDINEDSLDQSLYQPSAVERAALAAAGYTGFPTSGATSANTPFPFWRCIGQALLRDEPAEKCNGLLNRTRSLQHNSGASGQITWFSAPRGERNQFTAGAAYDRSRVDFLQSSQLGYLNPDRSITGVNSFGDGVTGGNVDGEPYDTRVDLQGIIHTGSIFATNTLSLGNQWSFTLSGRYNRTTIDNRDRIRPNSGTGSLTSQHVFSRFNPAIGVVFSPLRLVKAYLSYSEGSRAPTAVELGCADPNQPCKLPNALAGDPPLNQIVTRTWEAGLRGGIESRFNWNAGWFQADNRDDILFVASNQTGFGYFKNFGHTRRQGIELDLNGRIWRVSLSGSYTFLNATYQSAETVDGSSNSSNDGEAKGLEGTIQIQPGARIPLIPQHLLKAFADFQATSKFSVGLGLLALSSAYARGNENNLHQPDGQYYLGSGKSPGYAVVNCGARYQIHRRLEIFAQINNLFDRRYYTAAQLGPTGFTAEGNFIARPFDAVNGEFPVAHATFYAPGAPQGVWGGIRFKV
jgi:outer membrane receptor protein involved in Fe transport